MEDTNDDSSEKGRQRAEQCATTAPATVTDDLELDCIIDGFTSVEEMLLLFPPSPADCFNFDSNLHSPTVSPEISFSDVANTVTAEPQTAATDDLPPPPFPSEERDTDFWIAMAMAADAILSDTAANTTAEPTVSNLQYTGLLSGVVNDSPVNFPERYHVAKEEKARFWTKDEHILYLMGEEKYGKGNCKDIATKMVLTRTPSQVASHAQKYHLYHQNPQNRKRSRPSIFDITTVDPRSKARLLSVQPPSPPPSPPQQFFTVTNYHPPPSPPN